MAENERTSARIAEIAARGLASKLRDVTHEEILEVFGSALTQAPDHKRNALADVMAAAPDAHAHYNNLTRPVLADWAGTIIKR